MQSGDGARQFFEDLRSGMERRAWSEAKDTDELDSSGDSVMKKYYGDPWTFVFGVCDGIWLMKEDKSGDTWQESMDKFGYGTFGRGLRIGRRLAFYEPDQFDFKEPDSDDGFTFVETENDSDSQFTFVE